MILKTGKYNAKLSNYSAAISLAEKRKEDKIPEMDNNVKQIMTEMQKMKDNNILKNAINDYNEEEIEYSIYGREYGHKIEYVINRVILTTDGNETVGVEIEEKTGKLLYYITTPKYDILHNIGAEEVLRNYIKYLELYIIDDWEYDRNMLISEKAKLVAVLQTYDDHNAISIHSTNNEYIRERFNLT